MQISLSKYIHIINKNMKFLMHILYVFQNYIWKYLNNFNTCNI